VVDPAAWAELADLTTASSAHALAGDVSADRGHAALAQAELDSRGRVLVEVVDYRGGTGWVVAAVRAWLAAHPGGTVTCDALAAGTLADRLELAGITCTRTGPAQMARACADLLDGINNGLLGHRAQELLDAALACAGRRSLGDGWAWSRKATAVDISPLVAATLAAWSARVRPMAPAPFVVVSR
jgi:hypothetical protein